MAMFILNKKKVIDQYESLKGYADIVGYNYKTNPEVGKIIEKETNAPLVISFISNVDKISDKSRIIYIVQGETKDTLKNLVERGVKTFIVDNEADMKKLLDTEEEINLFLRLKVREHTIYTGKYFVYGIKWDRINKIIPELRKNKKIKKLGIHFHRKTQNVGEWSLVEEFSDSLTKDVLSEIDEIVIGGGIPVRYANSKPNIDSILKKILEFKSFLNSYGTKLSVEPGRYIAAPSVKLETNIINEYDGNLILDCSVYNAYIDTLLFNIRLPVEGETDWGYRYLLKGNSPDSTDIFRYKVFFEEKKKIGDKIVFLNAGAYNFYTEFGNMPKIKTIIK